MQQQAVERAELNLRSARGFFEVGTRPKSDVARAEVDVANARVDLIRARNAERLARVALNTAMGIARHAHARSRTTSSTSQGASIRPRSGRRPCASARRAGRPGCSSEARREPVERRPSATSSPTSRAAARTEARAPSWPRSGRGRWPLLKWSIYDGGGRIARYRETKANLEASRAAPGRQDLEIAREVEQAQLTVVESQERMLAAQTAVASAQENFRLAQGRFDAGVGTILELTDAQLALTQAQNLEAQALADYRIALLPAGSGARAALSWLVNNFDRQGV